jgi:glycosyltransferase involved in cell wall biosynthesis
MKPVASASAGGRMTDRQAPLRSAPKLCHVAATPEGAVWIYEQLRELRDRHGFDVSAILNSDRGTLVDRLRGAGIPVHVADFDFTSNADLLGLPRKVLALLRLLRRERFDIVQTHLFHSMVIGRIAAWFADVPVRFSMIAGPFHLEAYTPRWIDKFTCWTDTAIIASCEYTRTLYRAMGVRSNRLELIYYGPDESKFDPSMTVPANLRDEFGWSAETPVVAMVAYFYSELPHNRWLPPTVQGRSVKSQEDLINAAPMILREFPATKFLLIGSGWEDGGNAYMRRMQQLVTDLGLEKSILFTGFRTDIPSVLRDVNIAVQPSLSENLGGTIESLLMECPTVATRVGGLTDSIVDGETGILVEPSNPGSLAEGILRLLRDPVSARQYGAAGRRRMLARFTLRRTADSLAGLYRAKLQQHKAGYRSAVVLVRLILGSLLCLGIIARYGVLDSWLLRHWDQGWRPWRSNAATALPGRIWLYRLYAFVGRNSPSFRLRRRVATTLGYLKHKSIYLKHLTLYRFYAFIGRRPLGFGLRRRVAATPNYLKHKGIYLKHLTLYRLYAFIGRRSLGFGLRRRVAATPNYLKHKLIYLKHLTLYRLYAFTGRHPTNFGIWRRLKDLFI